MSFPEYVAKFRRKMVEIRSRFKETSRLGLYADYWVPPPTEVAAGSPFPTSSLSSSSTPTVPYSTADILYGSELNNRAQLEDIRQNSYGEIERGRDVGTPSRTRSKELEQHANNRRPNSKSGSRKSLSIEAVTIDREKDESLKSHSATLPPTKATNHFRPNGIRNNILKGEQLLTCSSSRPNGAVPSSGSGRDPDDLVAMGTLWSPNQPGSQQQQQQQQQMLQSRNSIPNNSINNNSYASTKGNVNVSSSASNTMTPQRKLYPSNNVRPIVVNNVSGIRNSLRERDKKVEEEPKYTDPLYGAPASFQQRLIELGALEGDTVRWERTKKLKKKKQDRDS